MKNRKWKIALVVLALGFALKWWFGAPTEAQLRARFVEHRAEFEELRTMAQRDAPSGRSGFGISATDFWRDDELKMSKSRIERYRTLMKHVGVIAIHGGKDLFRMPVFGGGFTDTTWSIGYAFSRQKPEIVVPSIYEWQARRDKTAYATLGGGWYLYNRR